MATRDPVVLWNNVIQSLLKAKESWSEFQARALEPIQLDEYPIKAQKFLSLATTRVGFEIAIPRLIDYYRVSGGLEELLVEYEPEESLEEKETENEKILPKGRRL